VRDLGREGSSFFIQHESGRFELRLNVPGRQNVQNALAATALALEMGISESHVIQGISTYEGFAGRFSIVDLMGGILLVDDTYNANPASLRSALDSLPGLVPEGGRIIAGLGDMLELGKESVSAHIAAGRMAAERGVDYLLAMGRYADKLIRGALDGGLPAERTKISRTHEEMAHGINKLLRSKDVLLLKASRGMRFDRIVELVAGAEKGGYPHDREEKNPGG
jgi:UDP-N-acetylmuramoyl-tripeptide--D-alanyl-D-alanine ligase